jgi:hypothetical protein
MTLRIFASLLTVLVTASCSKPADPVIARVTIETQGYSIENTHYESASEMIAGLKAVPRLDGVGITRLPGADEARVAQTIKAIQSAGITARIAIVGNEVFNK